MKYVKFVAANVKGGVACELGPRTVIVGPNGTGKSGVINALELATTGVVSDIAGRDLVKEAAALLQLTPDRKTAAWARAVIVDATTGELHQAQFAPSGSGKGKKSVGLVANPVVDPERVLPLRDVMAHVVGSAEKARKLLLGVAAPDLTHEKVLAEIPDELRPHLRAATMQMDMHASPADRLLGALDYAKKHAKKGKSAAEGGEKVAGVVADGLAPLPTDDVIQATLDEQKTAKLALDGLKQRQAQADQYQRMKREAGPLRQELEQANSNIAQLNAAIAQAQAQLEQTPAPALFDEHTLRVLAVRTACAELEAQAGTAVQCPTCKMTPPYGAFQQAKAQADAYVANEQAKAPGYALVKQHYDQLVANRSQWEAKAQTLAAQVFAVEQALEKNHVEAPTPEQIQAAENHWQNLTLAANQHATLKAQWAQAKKAQSVSTDTNEEANRWKALADACDKAAQKLLDEAVVAFTARVQAFLPDCDKFHLVLRDGTKAVFQFGLKGPDGLLRTALSGAEWARVTSAIASACIPNDGKLHIVIPEERAYDPQTLFQTMTAFSRVPGQVIIASPVAPTTVPPGWTVVDTTTNAHRSGQEG